MKGDKLQFIKLIGVYERDNPKIDFNDRQRPEDFETSRRPRAGNNRLAGNACRFTKTKMNSQFETPFRAALARTMGLAPSKAFCRFDLKPPVKMFGRDMTKEDAVRFLFGDQHEHLGQSIAYARSNGVVPPWSK